MQFLNTDRDWGKGERRIRQNMVLQSDTIEEMKDHCVEVKIKTMKLYTNIQRVEKELQELGVQEGDELTAEKLSQFDSCEFPSQNTSS